MRMSWRAPSPRSRNWVELTGLRPSALPQYGFPYPAVGRAGGISHRKVEITSCNTFVHRSCLGFRMQSARLGSPGFTLLPGRNHEAGSAGCVRPRSAHYGYRLMRPTRAMRSTGRQTPRTKKAQGLGRHRWVRLCLEVFLYQPVEGGGVFRTPPLIVDAPSYSRGTKEATHGVN